MAFTRNPSDTSVSPATYTAKVASDLLLVDQKRDIAIDGSDEKDLIFVSASALASSSLYNFDVRGFAGADTIDFRANLIQDSTINGNIGADTMYAGFSTTYGTGSTAFIGAGGITNLTNSYFLGGKDNDKMFGYGLNNGEINGNIGDDTLTINNLGVVAGFNMYVGGGQGNDLINVTGDFTGSIIDGNKGVDTINVALGTHSNTSVNGGEGNDILRAESLTTKGLKLNGDKGNDTVVSVGNLASTVTGGEGNDTIVSASLVGEKSVIDAGVGADTIVTANGSTTSAGAETIIFNQGDSVVATATSLPTTPGATLISGTVTFGNKVDTLASLGAEDKIDIDFTPKAFVEANGESNTLNLATDAVYEVKGNLSVDGKNVFTVADANGLVGGNAATDFLYVVGGQNLTLGQVFTNSTNMFISAEELSTGQFV